MLTGNNDDKLRGEVRYLKDNQGLSLRQIAKELAIPRDKVRGLYAGTFNERVPKVFILDPYRDLITGWFRQTPSLKSVQVWKRLLERGVTISERAVAEYTEKFRCHKKTKVHWPLSFLPGEEAQVDWFFVNHPILGKLCGFTLILSYSRFCFAHFFPRYTFEFFIEGHLKAFISLGGTPRALRYDNLKSVVIRRDPLHYNAAFLEFANYYGFEIKLCNPACGNEKGRVERLIRSIRDTFENTAIHHQSLGAINQELNAWIGAKNAAVHRATDAVPNVKKLEEKLKKLPVNPYPNMIVQAGKSPTKTGLVIFDTNSYSVPTHCRNVTIAVHATVDRVDFIDGKGNRVASHPRCFKKRQTLINPLHRSVTGLSEKAKRERIYAVVRALSDDIAEFLNQNENVGEDAYLTAHALFRLLKSQSRGVIESVAREALKRRSPRLKFIMSALHLDRDRPGEPVSPQNQELMTLNYQPRSLEEYENDNTDDKK